MTSPRLSCLTVLFAALSSPANAFVLSQNGRERPLATQRSMTPDEEEQVLVNDASLSRRRWLAQWSTAASLVFPTVAMAEEATSTDGESMFAPKFVQSYSDFVESPEGWSYRVVTPGKPGAAAAELGDRVVFDWSGYTIGYFGRPFQAKGGPQGGAFDKDLDYSRTVLGSHKVVSGLEQALMGMSAGEVRQVVVPFGSLSYPPDDLAHDKVGPKPTTFSGQRALNFVLENPRVDRTLLFNVKVVRVDKPNGAGGFIRG